MQTPPGSGNFILFTCLTENSLNANENNARIRNSLDRYIDLPLPSCEIKSINAAVSQGIKLLTTALIVSRLPACVICRLLFSVFLRDFYAKRLWATFRYCTVKLCDSLLGFLPLVESVSGQIKEEEILSII